MSPIVTEIIIGFVFFLVGLVVRPLWDQAWYQRRTSTRNERDIADALEQASDDSGFNPFHGGFRVDNIKTVFSCLTPATAIPQEDLFTEYEPEERRLPGDIELLKNTYWPALQQASLRDGKKCEDDPAYSLEQFVVGRPAVGDSRQRKLTLTLRFTPTSFATFATTNLMLDDPRLDDSTGKVSIREKYDLKPGSIDFDHLDRLPLHLRFGTNTVVVTRDNFIVLTIRSTTQLMDSGGNMNKPYRVHVVGEGMLGGHDVDDLGKPSPFATVQRALKDELGLEDKHYNPADVRLLALNFDYNRCQPIALFAVRLNTSFDELVSLGVVAKDRHEHSGLVPLRNDPSEVYSLLTGQKSYRGRKLIAAVNHAQMSLMLSQFHFHPYAAVRAAFER